MREILFRAKCKDTGEWVEGVPSHDVYGILAEMEVYKGFCSCKFFEVDPETVCQYTGLTDENGRKIFEGDIVSGVFDGGRIIGFVKYGSNAGYYIERSGLYGILLDNAQDWLEIVGNIYDNPELAEGEVQG